jgi:phosphoribosylglycinamide formyltransferase-1
MNSRDTKLNAPKETFVGDSITPEVDAFSVSPMATGAPGLPGRFIWEAQSFSVLEVLEQWKETGSCRNGSGERYVRKHWFRIRTTGDLEMKVYFERQARSSGGSRWRLYSIRRGEDHSASKEIAQPSAGRSARTVDPPILS